MNENLKYYCFCRFKLNVGSLRLRKEINTLITYSVTRNFITELASELCHLDHDHFTLTTNQSSSENFKFKTDFISNNPRGKTARICFYVLCRYQLIGNQDKVIKEAVMLYNLDAPNHNQLDCLIRDYWKHTFPEDPDSKQAIENLKKLNEALVNKIRKLEYELGFLNRQKKTFHSNCIKIKGKFDKYKSDAELEVNNNKSAIYDLENKLKEMACKHKSLELDYANYKNESEVEIARLNYLVSITTHEEEKQINIIEQQVDRIQLEEIYLNSKELYGNLRNLATPVEKMLANYTNNYLISQILIYISGLNNSMSDFISAKFECEKELNNSRKENAMLHDINKKLKAKNNEMIASFKKFI